MQHHRNTISTPPRAISTVQSTASTPPMTCAKPHYTNPTPRNTISKPPITTTYLQNTSFTPLTPYQLCPECACTPNTQHSASQTRRHPACCAGVVALPAVPRSLPRINTLFLLALPCGARTQHISGPCTGTHHICGRSLHRFVLELLCIANSCRHRSSCTTPPHGCNMGGTHAAICENLLYGTSHNTFIFCLGFRLDGGSLVCTNRMPFLGMHSGVLLATCLMCAQHRKHACTPKRATMDCHGLAVESATQSRTINVSREGCFSSHGLLCVTHSCSA